MPPEHIDDLMLRNGLFRLGLMRNVDQQTLIEVRSLIKYLKQKLIYNLEGTLNAHKLFWIVCEFKNCLNVLKDNNYISQSEWFKIMNSVEKYIVEHEKRVNDLVKK